MLLVRSLDHVCDISISLSEIYCVVDQSILLSTLAQNGDGGYWQPYDLMGLTFKAILSRTGNDTRRRLMARANSEPTLCTLCGAPL